MPYLGRGAGHGQVKTPKILLPFIKLPCLDSARAWLFETLSVFLTSSKLYSDCFCFIFQFFCRGIDYWRCLVCCFHHWHSKTFSCAGQHYTRLRDTKILMTLINMLNSFWAIIDYMVSDQLLTMNNLRYEKKQLHLRVWKAVRKPIKYLILDSLVEILSQEIRSKT